MWYVLSFSKFTLILNFVTDVWYTSFPFFFSDAVIWKYLLILQIIKRANEAGETVTSLSSRFINEFLLDMAQLQCLPPTCEPRVTDHIEHIIELITKVFWTNAAYNTNPATY